MMGIVVVLIMSAGTLLGTSSTFFALLYSSGIATLLTSVTSVNWSKPAALLSPVLVLMALWIARQNLIDNLHRIRISENTSQRTRAVWRLFSSLHGFAWMRRVQDRINQFAPRERWTVQLKAVGFQSTADISNRELPDAEAQDEEPTDDELMQPLDAFIWVLARFADESWLRQILQNSQKPQNPLDPSKSPK